MNKKLGLTNFQIGILFFLGILTCTFVAGTGFFILNRTTQNQNFNFTLSNPQNEIINKWEADNGTLYEFFPDGTVTANESIVSMAGKYSFPDETHIKMEFGHMANIREYAVSSNEFILGNQTLKKYQEFELTPQKITGTWQRAFNSNNQCFKGLGLTNTPQQITLGIDSAFSLTDQPDISMTGQYAINSGNLRIIASGTNTHTPSNFAATTGQPPTPVPNIIQLQGEFECAVTLSNSRLNFKDPTGQSALFVRAQSQ